ncbi:hypothetical protein Pdsh_01540 [Pyrodictium delaneyi]|uniref:PepSY domain-containing protein n=1 Tax=Pyrodictium delaneyi TaxID=1273541 RepID=A0A211YRG9_9CREN|nr:hypothetical protein Pdsh_01540 [Pyrodictium delaneyi]
MTILVILTVVFAILVVSNLSDKAGPPTESTPEQKLYKVAERLVKTQQVSSIIGGLNYNITRIVPVKLREGEVEKTIWCIRLRLEKSRLVEAEFQHPVTGQHMRAVIWLDTLRVYATEDGELLGIWPELSWPPEEARLDASKLSVADRVRGILAQSTVFSNLLEEPNTTIYLTAVIYDKNHPEGLALLHVNEAGKKYLISVDLATGTIRLTQENPLG